ncbi:hypothetical protein H2201_008593 [Coniosporium apollinis]|uniref:Heterokaryon incompatibility domain-containing protein n=1 Tax=Coniosporium apollinis TaxID=61459 RepID=A0ABQ9NI89_9PEZI|nr:hypothetical protein H2201_008593 [Coniosporium apollinis]
MAISRMKATYERASSVLVLDTSLENIVSAGITSYEVVLRILTCPWQTRLWTYQEACLASNLLFKFADRAVNLKTTIGGLEDLERPMDIPDYFSLVRSYMSSRFSEHAEDYPMPAAKRFAKTMQFIIDSLAFRSTTVPSDEVICLAALLKLPVTELLKTPEDQMRPAFWVLMEYIPAEIIFARGPKLQQPGFCWAPATFLGITSGFATSPLTTYSKLTSAGLEVGFPGFLLSAPEQTEPKITFRFCFRTGSADWYLVTLPDNNPFSPTYQGEAVAWWKSFSSAKLALIEAQSVQAPGVANAGSGTEFTHLLTEVWRVNEGTIFVKRMASVYVAKANARETETLNFLERNARGRTNLEDAEDIDSVHLEDFETFEDWHDRLQEFLALQHTYHGIIAQRLEKQVWCVD